MPTDQRIQSAIIEIAEQLDQIGYEIDDTRGPVDAAGEAIPEDEVDEAERFQYYLIAGTSGTFFYILFDSQGRHATVVYPFDVLRHLGQGLSDEEVEAILDQSIEWNDLQGSEADLLYSQAAETIIGNTPPKVFDQPAFNLSIYASSAIVDYRQTQTETGFPREFQSARVIFPYTEHMSLSQLNERVNTVIIAGERGRRYVEYAFAIDTEDKQPQNYEFVALF